MSDTRYLIQLNDAELHALGGITYLWAIIDDLLATNSLFCSEYYKVPLGRGFKSNTFSTRREAWRLLVLDLPGLPANRKTAILSIDGRIAKAANKRDEIIHGVAMRAIGGGIQFLRHLPPRKIEHRSDLKAMQKFGNELQLIAGELVKMLGWWGH